MLRGREIKISYFIFKSGFKKSIKIRNSAYFVENSTQFEIKKSKLYEVFLLLLCINTKSQQFLLRILASEALLVSAGMFNLILIKNNRVSELTWPDISDSQTRSA